MKVLCKSCFFIGLLMTFSLTACSDDDDDTVAPVFPEKQNIVCNAGEKKNSLLQLILTGVWHLLLFGVSFKPMIQKNILYLELPEHKR